MCSSDETFYVSPRYKTSYLKFKFILTVPQMYFKVEVIRPTKLTASQFPPEVEAEEGTEVQFAIQVQNAYPPPVIQWFLNTGKGLVINYILHRGEGGLGHRAVMERRLCYGKLGSMGRTLCA